jgi:hypothetical protein
VSASARLDKTGRALVVATAVGAALWFAASLSAWLGVLAGLDALVGLPRPVRGLALPAGVLAALTCGAWFWRRGRRARSRSQVALWVEERVPTLRYALATLADASCAESTATAALEAQVATSDWSAQQRRAVMRAWTVPTVVLAAGALALVLLPRGAVARVGRPRPGDVLDAIRPAAARRSILAPLVAVVTAPAYTRRSAETLEEPANVAGLAGSDVTVQGSGDASRIRALLGTDSVRAVADGGRWRLRFRMPGEPAALRLADGVRERLLTIEPHPDSAPVVTLRLPLRDSVLRAARGTIVLAAELSDDIGLASGWFEFIVSSGDGESFSFRSGVLARAALEGARRSERRIILPLDSLRLAPGDVVHLRAVATDANDVGGPGRGVSETRTLRIARAGEYDSLANLGLPSIVGDTSALSQRMLIMLAEALERRRPGLRRDTVVEESRAIASDQARLRRRVSDIIFLRVAGETPGEEQEGGGDANRPTTPEQVMAAAESAASRGAGEALDFAESESPVVAINRPLLEAYNAMWEAGRWLEIGEPDDALPHMRAALAAIERARQAERVYLRGRPPTQVVDLRQVRLAGDRAGAASSRRLPAAPLGAERGRLARRLDAALARAGVSAAEAADSLLLLRLEALGRFPAFVAQAGRAAAALRAGHGATAELLRAREALLGEPRHVRSLPAWEAAP